MEISRTEKPEYRFYAFPLSVYRQGNDDDLQTTKSATPNNPMDLLDVTHFGLKNTLIRISVYSRLPISANDRTLQKAL